MTTTMHLEQGIPGVYGLLLLDVVSRWGYNDTALFEPFGLTSEQLAHPEMRISVEVANALIKRAHELTGEPSLGFHLGTQMRISIHGFIGYAIMTTQNTTEALVLASRFIQLRMPFLQLYFSTFSDQATIELKCHIDLQPLRNEIIMALTIGILTMGNALTGQELRGEIDFDFAQPEGFERYQNLINSTFRFNQPHLLASFDKSYLGLNMVHADSISSQVAINYCESELSALGERRRLSMKVRDILTEQDQHLGIEAVAERLFMSDRTLKRQLANEGTSFSTIVDEVRYRRATALLSRTDYSLEHISDE